MPQGTLEVFLIKASGLENTDLLSKMDPYAILTCGTQEQKSSVAKGEGTEPEWNETFLFSICEGTSELNIKLMDKDCLTKDDFVGETLILLWPVFKNGHIEPYTYNVIKGDKYCGQMNIGLTFTPDEKYLFPREFSITWGEEEQYWQWTSIAESSSTSDEVVEVEVAELLAVCWLDVNGKLDISHLCPGGVEYEVVFVVKLKEEDEATGWEIPVNLRLVLPDGTTQEHQVCLEAMPRSQWLELRAGEFKTLPLPEKHHTDRHHHHHRKATGGDHHDEQQLQAEKAEIQFSLFEHGGHWKGGLVVKGVIVRPKK
ncbi:C2 calcium-dependent membrane targeting [Macleaya cordata]|uniref:C2 calcium-dependent membrane targeting n=1 Tax=Macleaya cordata TaxID=56857 RepID=A0A200QN24_MACCD|nr:C2 calcium-dependent membrane targeting [Macleaya cordata]